MGIPAGVRSLWPRIENFLGICRKSSCKIAKFKSLFKCFTKFLRGCGKTNRNNWKFNQSRTFWWWSRPKLANFLSSFPKFSYWRFNFFPNFAGRPPRHQLIFHYSEYKWFGSKPSQTKAEKIYKGLPFLFCLIIKKVVIKWKHLILNLLVCPLSSI